ncbi:MAG: sigma factor-like helix-turn-helix DNA-binding protein, partial [Pseudonocardiaceae bacterium]
RQTVLNELRGLPPGVKTAVAAVVISDQTFADVADQLGLTERAVEGRLYRYRTEAARRKTQRRIL